MQTNFNPFDKPIDEITLTDLETLKGLSEGWYVEYKSASISSKDYAKSISALANTYGGWFFVGVQEKSKEEPVAGSFPGIEIAELEKETKKVTTAVADHLNPAPFYKTKIITGKVGSSILDEDKAVICIQVPWSPQAPHIHKDGRIYKRVGDSSSPKNENDRYIIEQMLKRSQAIEETTRDWIESDPFLLEQESETSYLRALFQIDPWMQNDPWLSIPISEIRELLSSEEPGLASVPFDSVHHSEGGFIARQTLGNDPSSFLMTIKCRWNLSCELIVPIPRVRHDDYHTLGVLFDDYECGDRFLNTLESRGFKSPCILDLNFVYACLVGFIQKYRRLLDKAGVSPKFFYKTKLINVQRTIPFFDVEEIVEHFEKYGPPVALEETLMSTGGTSPNSFRESVMPSEDLTVPEGSEFVNFIHSIWQTMFIFADAFLPIGIPPSFGEQDTKYLSFMDYQNAVERAQKATKFRQDFFRNN